MPIDSDLRLSTLPRPHDFTPSLADVLSSTSVLSLSSSTPSPPESPNLVMALASRIPPELLLDIFSIVSDSPSKDHEQYLKRNQNLKSFALVHRTWRPAAREILQQEVYVGGSDQETEMISNEELERIASFLIDGKVGNTKYLTVDGHLNELVAKTGYEAWNQVRYLKLSSASRNDESTWMSDVAPFLNLEQFHLNFSWSATHGGSTFLRFAPSDVNLRFSHLTSITFGWEVGMRVVHDFNGAAGERKLATAHKLFSPSNMPNLAHLALWAFESTLPIYVALFAKVLPQITSLAITGDTQNETDLFPENPLPPNLRHWSLDTGENDPVNLFRHNQLDLQSLHLSTLGMSADQEMLPRLIKIAKGEDPKYRIGRIVIYGKRKDMEIKYSELIDDLDVFEWREDRDWPPFEGFDGR